MTIDSRRIRPLQRSEYDHLVEAGVFDDEKIELIDGALVEMSPEGVPHSWAIQQLNRMLARGLPDELAVRVGHPWVANDISEPEPDIAVVPARRYDHDHPDTAVLLIEVSHSSRRFDLGHKARVYAAAGVPEYWVVDLDEGRVVVHAEPTADEYERRTHHLPPTTLDAAGVAIAIADLFPD